MVVLISATFSLIGAENKEMNKRADLKFTSALIFDVASNGSAPTESIINDAKGAFINVLDFISNSSSGACSKPSIVDSLSETLSVLDFLSSLEQVDSISLSKRNQQRTNRLYSGKLPDVDRRKFRRPVKGRITSTFGPNPERNTVHYGVDLKGKTGDTVRVALPGRVKYCKNDPNGYGLYVCVVDSIGIETRYAHLSKILVKKGDKLSVAAPIGLVGSTGNSTGPHLHFEMRYKGQLLDPTLFLE